LLDFVLGMPQPFSAPWSTLANNVHVLRDKRLLEKLQDCIKTRKRVDIDSTINFSYLVPVKLVSNSGKPQNLARIYIPNEKDFIETILNEPVHHDDQRIKRKQLRVKMDDFLKQWRKDRKREKSGKPRLWKSEDETLIRESSAKLMRDTWLPEVEVQNIRSLAGFVVLADFSFVEAKGVALGYVTLKALLEAMMVGLNSKKQPFFWVRNVHDFCYHKAVVEILLD